MTPALRRLTALVTKEWQQILRDPSALAIAFAVPLLLLFLFGYGVSLDMERVPVGVVNTSDSPEARDFIGSLGNHRYFRLHNYATLESAKADLLSGKILAVVRLSEDFARKVDGSGNAPIQVLAEGVDANSGRVIQGYLDGAMAQWLQWRGNTGQAPDASAPAIETRVRIWFNPEVESKRFLVPGLIAIIMTVIGTLLTALVVAREWERGTMEALMATPVTRAEFLVSKVIPYFLLGMGGMFLSVIVALFVFDVPFRGSFAALLLMSAVFMLTALGLGLFISSATRNQFLAGQFSLIAGYLPAFMLSGFLFDLHGAPRFIDIISHIVAARYFVSALQSLFLVGTVWPILLPDLFAMLVIAGVLLAATYRLTRKELV